MRFFSTVQEIYNAKKNLCMQESILNGHTYTSGENAKFGESCQNFSSLKFSVQLHYSVHEPKIGVFCAGKLLSVSVLGINGMNQGNIQDWIEECRIWM